MKQCLRERVCESKPHEDLPILGPVSGPLAGVAWKAPHRAYYGALNEARNSMVPLKVSITATKRAIIRIYFRGLNNCQYYLGAHLGGS